MLKIWGIWVHEEDEQWSGVDDPSGPHGHKSHALGLHRERGVGICPTTQLALAVPQQVQGVGPVLTLNGQIKGGCPSFLLPQLSTMDSNETLINGAVLP